jgi:hypothetical protein
MSKAQHKHTGYFSTQSQQQSTIKNIIMSESDQAPAFNRPRLIGGQEGFGQTST